MTDQPTENTDNHAPSAQPVPARAEEARPQAATAEPVEFEVRVAPKPGAFMVTGGALGVIVAGRRNRGTLDGQRLRLPRGPLRDHRRWNRRDRFPDFRPRGPQTHQTHLCRQGKLCRRG